MSKNVFNSVAVRKPSQNTFNLSHDKKFSCDMGELVPIACMDALPGDVFRLKSEILVRFAPLIAPVMHRVNVHVHYFFVPNRIVWPNWEAFVSPPEADSVAPAAPTTNIVGDGIDVGTIGDYLGLPTGVPLTEDNGSLVSAIPSAGYIKIFNEYYRDQNLIDPILGDTLNDGFNDSCYNIPPFPRSWMHDYFTGALPFAQKGAPVGIPMGFEGMAPVQINAGQGGAASWSVDTVSGSPTAYVGENPTDDPTISQDYLYANLTQQSLTGTINDLRVAMRTQEFLERQARGGSRYIEQIRMQFGVKSSDSRLQRPEFIGGTSSPVVISEVLQTSESQDTPQANMAGHGVAASHGKSFRYYSEEHGYIFAILSITPNTAYQQGIPRHFSRTDLYDYAWPVLAHIGEQEVLNKELYVGTDNANEQTFGYVPRYSEYRYIPSSVAGDFRDTLSYWHLGRIFEERPALNAEFIACNPSKRIFAVSGEDVDQDSMWCHAFHSIRATRRLPKYGTPTL